jgi:hypothetical protein
MSPEVEARVEAKRETIEMIEPGNLTEEGHLLMIVETGSDIEEAEREEDPGLLGMTEKSIVVVIVIIVNREIIVMIVEEKAEEVLETDMKHVEVLEKMEETMEEITKKI